MHKSMRLGLRGACDTANFTALPVLGLWELTDDKSAPTARKGFSSALKQTHKRQARM